MRAIVLEHAGPPKVLEIRSEPRPGWVLIQVKAFGLNCSELFTRASAIPPMSPFHVCWASNVLGGKRCVHTLPTLH